MARLGVLVSLTFFLVPFLTACSSYLYYPTRIKYINPEKIPHKPQEVTFYENAESKEKLTAWQFKTPQKSKGVFVVFHGNAQNVSTHFVTMYWALDKGYDVFIFDYPGYGGSHGDPTPQNTVESGTRAIQYVQKNYNVPIIIVGQSLGGAIALRTVADLEDRKNICAFVADSTFTSYKRVGRKALSNFWLTWPLQWLPYLVLSNEWAPKGHVDKISPIPLLVIHRMKDPIIPFELSEDVYSEAKDPRQKWDIPGEGHVNTFTGVDRVENQKHFLDYIESHCEN